MMITFDLYCRSTADEWSPEDLSNGATIALDGCDGFFDQYFSAAEQLGRDRLQFLVVEDGLAGMPRSPDAFQSLRFVRGTILANFETSADVRVDQVSSFGELRNSALFAESLEALPANARPEPSLAESLRKEAEKNQSALWIARQRHWTSLDYVSALLVLRVVEGFRWAIVRTNAVSSFLVLESDR